MKKLLAIVPSLCLASAIATLPSYAQQTTPTLIEALQRGGHDSG